MVSHLSSLISYPSPFRSPPAHDSGNPNAHQNQSDSRQAGESCHAKIDHVPSGLEPGRLADFNPRQNPTTKVQDRFLGRHALDLLPHGLGRWHSAEMGGKLGI